MAAMQGLSSALASTKSGGCYEQNQTAPSGIGQNQTENCMSRVQVPVSKMPFLRWGRDRFTRARNANTPGHSIIRPPHGQQHDDFTGIFPGPSERRSPARSRLVKSDIPEEVDRGRIFTIHEKNPRIRGRRVQPFGALGLLTAPPLLIVVGERAFSRAVSAARASQYLCLTLSPRCGRTWSTTGLLGAGYLPIGITPLACGVSRLAGRRLSRR